MEHAGTELVSDFECPPNIRADNAGSQTVLRVVSEPYGIFIRVEGHNNCHRPKNFFTKRRVIRFDVAEHCRLEEQLLVATSNLEFRTRLLS
ncbi:hypothetical protein D9M71_721060 [compost metagenome]